MNEQKTYQDIELLYSATARCKCGAGLAYPLDHESAMRLACWACSRVLKGEADGYADPHPSARYILFLESELLRIAIRR